MSIENLQSKLDIIRAWRKIELSHAKSMAERYSSSAELPYLCRSWIMMIYAHCDQSLKLIGKEYLLFLKDFPRDNYNYKTVWLSFFGKEALRRGGENRFSMCGEDSFEIREKIISNINGKEVFESGSFSYNQLRFFTEWVMQLPFPYIYYKGFCDTLKEKRDAIAHGEEVSIRGVEDCIYWHDPAIELLDKLVDSTIEAAMSHQNIL